MKRHLALHLGIVTGGHGELLYCRGRAEAAQEDGEAWGEALAAHWGRALERYTRVYRIGRA